MDKEMQGMPADAGWKKAISLDRDRLQSRLLVSSVGSLLIVIAAAAVVGAAKLGHGSTVALPLLLSFGFAAAVWMLRAATAPAAVMGFLVCFILSQEAAVYTGFAAYPVFYPAIPALVAMFVITFAATKYGRAKKEARGLAELRKGRRASQIVANLGIAALCGALGAYDGCIAALAEAAADTASSEIGQAVGGPAWLITKRRRVAAGTDGGISVAGTAAGVAAAGVVVAMGALHHALWPDKMPVFVAACAGLFFDSLMGATVERWGWVANDLVNFASTLFAAVVAIGLRSVLH